MYTKPGSGNTSKHIQQICSWHAGQVTWLHPPTFSKNVVHEGHRFMESMPRERRVPGACDADTAEGRGRHNEQLSEGSDPEHVAQEEKAVGG